MSNDPAACRDATALPPDLATTAKAGISQFRESYVGLWCFDTASGVIHKPFTPPNFYGLSFGQPNRRSSRWSSARNSASEGK